jgi:F-type H+-transporting ATPase subunit b
MQASQHQGADHAAPSRQSHGVTELGAPAAGVAEQATGDAHGADAHGGEHHQEFNWLHGMVGVKEGVEPSLLWRTPDMPIPFAAVLLNTALLFGLIFKFARKPVAKALADRRQRIMRGIEDATAMKEEAKRQLEFYRAKLDNLDAEIERVRREMREGAETERKRILEEAGTRRTRLEQEARLLMDQELKALREELTRETAKAALRSALELLRTNTSTDDHRRLCEQYLETFQPPSPRQGDVGGRS